jgi:hypothetical protein
MGGTNHLLTSITRTDFPGWNSLVTHSATTGLNIQTIRALSQVFIEMLHAKRASPAVRAAVRMVQTDLLSSVGAIFLRSSLVVDIGYLIAYVDLL